jgi:hypothetical protein
VSARFGRIGDQRRESVCHHQAGYGHLIHFQEPVEEALAHSRNSGTRFHTARHNSAGIAVCISHSIADKQDVIARLSRKVERLDLDSALGTQLPGPALQFDRQIHAPGALKLEEIGAVDQAGSPVAIQFRRNRSSETPGDVFTICSYFEFARSAEISRLDHQIDSLPDQ